jgi:hypothetical protein
MELPEDEDESSDPILNGILAGADQIMEENGGKDPLFGDLPSMNPDHPFWNDIGEEPLDSEPSSSYDEWEEEKTDPSLPPLECLDPFSDDEDDEDTTPKAKPDLPPLPATAFPSLARPFAGERPIPDPLNPLPALDDGDVSPDEAETPVRITPENKVADLRRRLGLPFDVTTGPSLPEDENPDSILDDDE